MYNIAVNLIMELPGRTLMSEQECSRKVRKPLTKKGKQVYNKKHEEVWTTVVEADPKKTHIERVDISGEGDRPEFIDVRVRNAKPVRRIMNISQEAFNHFIDPDEVPYNYVAPLNTIKKLFWARLTVKAKLEWHLHDLCKSLGGTLVSYKVLE